jgi:CRP-like cAMP-binding protein
MKGPLNLEQVLGFLFDTPMFAGLDVEELSEIVHILQIQHLREGQVLFQEGDPGDGWYVVYEGEIEVRVDSDGEGPQLLDRVVAPGHFGELAMLDGSLRSATAAAGGSATVLKVPREAFQLLLREDSLAAYKLVHQLAIALAGRHREMTRHCVELTHRGPEPTVIERMTPLLRTRRRSE